MNEGKMVSEAVGLVSKKFVCDICGSEHDTEKEAIKCVVSCTG